MQYKYSHFNDSKTICLRTEDGIFVASLVLGVSSGTEQFDKGNFHGVKSSARLKFSCFFSPVWAVYTTQVHKVAILSIIISKLSISTRHFGINPGSMEFQSALFYRLEEGNRNFSPVFNLPLNFC